MFLNFSSVFKKTVERLGIDIDSKSIKVTRLKRVGQGFKVVDFHVFNVSLSQISLPERLDMKTKIKKMSGGIAHAAVSIENPSLRIRRMDFPKMPHQDLIEAIKWNFRENINCSIEEYTVGYIPIVGWGEGDMTCYVAFGVSNKAINERIEMINQIGLEVTSVEPRATALLAAINDNIDWQPKSPVVCLYLGDFSAYFTVMSDSQLLFSRPLPGISYDALSRHLSRNLNVELNAAQSILNEYVYPGHGAKAEEEAVINALAGFYRETAIETQRSIDSFCLLFKVERVDKLYLCGGGVYCPGFSHYMGETLGMPAQIFNPFVKAINNNLDENIKGRSSIFAVAYGLAIP